MSVNYRDPITGELTTIAGNSGYNITFGMIAEEFDQSKSYSVGDLVVYNYGLYKFTSAHTADDPWDPTEVTQTTVDDEKVSKVQGKGLSTEDYTTAEKTKLANIDLATSNSAGLVKPDGSTIAVDENGTLSVPAREYVSATAVSGDTYRALLNRLAALLDFSKITPDSYIEDTGFANMVHQIWRVTATPKFTGATAQCDLAYAVINDKNSNLAYNLITLYPGGNCKLRVVSSSSSGTIYNDYSDTPVYTGAVMKFVY